MINLIHAIQFFGTPVTTAVLISVLFAYIIYAVVSTSSPKPKLSGSIVNHLHFFVFGVGVVSLPLLHLSFSVVLFSVLTVILSAGMISAPYPVFLMLFFFVFTMIIAFVGIFAIMTLPTKQKWIMSSTKKIRGIWQLFVAYRTYPKKWYSMGAHGISTPMDKWTGCYSNPSIIIPQLNGVSQ